VDFLSLILKINLITTLEMNMKVEMRLMVMCSVHCMTYWYKDILMMTKCTFHHLVPT